MVTATALLGTLVYVPSVTLAVSSRMYGLAALDTSAILAVLALGVLERRIPARARAFAASGIFYVLGVGLMITVGSISQIYLFGFSALATLLLGGRWGLGTVGLNAGTVWAIGLYGAAAPDMVVPRWPMDAAGWTIVTANFVFVNLCLVLAVGAVIGALEAALEAALQANAALEAEAEERLRGEVVRRRLEAELLQSKKLEALGSLAGGVAHDFNNLLSVVLSYSELVLGDPALAPTLRADLQEIQQAGRRATDLTRQLLAFGRKQFLRPEVLDVGEVVDSVVSMMVRVVGEQVELVRVAPTHTGRCNVDRGQLEQVLVNLVVNARDAMPTGGRLSIETADAELDGGAFVMIAVTDTGVGMDRTTQERIFDPFFTTKDKSRGTGLGLAIAHGIVQQSGGRLLVYSEPGHGATFKVYLPRTDDPAASRPVRAPSPPATLRGTETVLLVEDEPQVRDVTRMVLQRHGYRVLEAESGPDALARWAGSADAIELLLTDVVMPRMNGRELAERMVEARPSLRVLYVSGYTEDTIVHRGVVDAGIAFLPKPVMPEVLLRKVREVLDGPRPPISRAPGGTGAPPLHTPGS